MIFFVLLIEYSSRLLADVARKVRTTRTHDQRFEYGLLNAVTAARDSGRFAGYKPPSTTCTLDNEGARFIGVYCLLPASI